MNILNFGSLNIDNVYRVTHINRPGETLNTNSLQHFAGGKGLNQSIALSRAGARVYHAGKVGKDGLWLIDELKKSGVDCGYIKVDPDIPTGHANIQVDESGENAILLYGGANRTFTHTEIDNILDNFGPGDMLLLQNEINELPYILEKAHNIGMKITLNPAPVTEEIYNYPLELVDTVVVNETEAEFLSDFIKNCPEKEIIITLGSNGLLYSNKDHIINLDSYSVDVVDTTAAGDTFIGYFLAAKSSHLEIRESLKMGLKAAAISVTKLGASTSIPYLKDLD